MIKDHSYIKFMFNGKLQELLIDSESGVSSQITVLEWLRSLGHYNGVKEGCAEGDCGACTVVLGELIKSKIQYKAVTSCILFLPYLHGKHLITVEYLSTLNKGEYSLHLIQEILAKHNASQCGYCTPGIVMSLFSFYKNDKQKEDVSTALSGNLCRCTGYESIKNAAFEIAELSGKEGSEDEFDKDHLAILEQINKDHFSSNHYHQPRNLEEALNLKNEKLNLLIVAGATDMALLKTKYQKDLGDILDLSHVEELKKIKKYHTYWEIGAGVNVEDLRLVMREEWPDFKSILDVFGSNQIRSVATLGGNIASASPIGDLLPLLIVHQSQIIIQKKNQLRAEDIEGFIQDYRTNSLSADEMITRIIIPIDKGWIYWSEKVSKRTQLDISSVMVALAFRLTEDQKIGAVVIAYGGMANVPKRASQTEAFLLGRSFEEKSFLEAAEIIKQDYKPLSDVRSSQEGRLVLASNLLLKFYYQNQ